MIYSVFNYLDAISLSLCYYKLEFNKTICFSMQYYVCINKYIKYTMHINYIGYYDNSSHINHTLPLLSERSNYNREQIKEEN